jgi:hypothetical protein
MNSMRKSWNLSQRSVINFSTSGSGALSLTVAAVPLLRHCGRQFVLFKKEDSKFKKLWLKDRNFSEEVDEEGIMQE